MEELGPHPPIIDMSNWENRKAEISDQLMEAGITSGAYPDGSAVS
jgi:hypothetical protein